MENSEGTLELIAKEFEKIIEPITEKLDQDQLLSLLEQLGIRFQDIVGTNSGITNAVNSIVTKVTSLINKGIELVSAIAAEDVDRILNIVSEMIGQLKAMIEDFDTLSVALQNAASPFGSVSASDISQFTSKLAVKLIEYTFLTYLERNYTILHNILEFPGIISRTPQNLSSTDLDKPPYTLRELKLDRISELLDSPQALFQALYGWGGNALDVDLLMQRLAGLLGLMNVPIDIQPPGGVIPTKSLRIGILQLIPDLTTNPNSLKLEFAEELSATDTIEVPLGLDNWFLETEFGGQLEAGVSVVLTPPFQLSFQPIAAEANFTFQVSLVGRKPDGTPFILLGQAGGSRLEAGEVRFSSGANLVYDIAANEASGSAFLETEIKDGKLAIDFSGSDGFLGQILQNVKLDLDFGFTIGVDSTRGFYFVGSSQLEIALPIHIDLSVVEIKGLTIQIRPDGSGIPIDLGADLQFNLGPMVAVVENMGITSNFSFPGDKKGGNLGPLDFSLGFKPPNGVGLSVDAGAVKGGGYLFFDFDREEYAGALELVFSEWIALKAIGLITTRMPDGSKGFSLLIIITVEFGAGIQLGFGFTLLGVGGILGLNRTVNIQPLAEGVRTGAIESVMFPQNVVENAPRIISDLRLFFPPIEGIFLVGPMAKIGYGTPTLISISLGVIIEFPDVTITILGVLKVVLPTEEADVLRLQVNFIGRIEPSNQLLWFYAELYDSRVLFMTLEGGMGLLVNWGDQANFVVSIGGFHPRFSPPPLPFPSPPRLAITILDTSIARIRIEGYFAVTSNTVQFGALAQLYFGFSAISVEGHLGFDALFQFNPFYFILEISAKLSVKVFGFGVWSISLSASLEGPTPWHIKGKASFKVTWLGPKIKVNIEKTWGENKATELPPVAIFPLLTRELDALTNWEAIIPQNTQILVSLRQLGDSNEDQLVLHPVGKLRIRQRKMPLNLQMDKFGTQRPSDYHQFALSATISGLSLTPTDVQDKFASSEFLDLDDSKKLSSPGFEPQDSGIEIAVQGQQLRTSLAVKRENRYETIIIDNNFKRFRRNVYQFADTIFSQFGVLFGYFLRGSAVTKSVLSQSHQQKLQPFAEVIEVLPNMYAVVLNTNNQPVNAAGVNFSSQAKAQQHMQAELRRDPSLAGGLHVIPNTELNLAA